MLHCRTDYNRIQDPALSDPSLLSPGSSPIGFDEPVFLLRAKDRCAPASVEMWAVGLELAGGDPETIAAVRQWAQRMREWQVEHGAKTPDTPRECLETGAH